MNAFFAEFFGTAMIIVFGGGVVANVLLSNTKGNNSGWIVITFGWAVGVFTGVLISAPVSGAHLNPAVTLALVIANKFSLKNNFILICGHYKGIDERVITKYVTMEISIGDYVISCGDIAAIVFMDSVSRLIPGVLGDGESAITDSFQTETGFDYPQYTRPEEFDGLKVPDVLLSGNHSEINKWRIQKAEEKFKKIKINNNINRTGKKEQLNQWTK